MMPVFSVIDWATLSTNPAEWFAYPFTNILGGAFWVIVFAVIIAVVWVVSDNDVGATVASILITFGIFGGTQYFISAPEYSLFFAIICAVGIAGTILQLFLGRND